MQEVTVKMFQSVDGKLFTTQVECETHERQIGETQLCELKYRATKLSWCNFAKHKHLPYLFAGYQNARKELRTNIPKYLSKREYYDLMRDRYATAGMWLKALQIGEDEYRKAVKECVEIWNRYAKHEPEKKNP